jgi:NADPH:quinone reductase-like Zn-dependent oxidoreductase
MPEMNAAVVTSFDRPPHYQRFPVPEPKTSDEFLVDVLAVGLHPRTKTGAAGAHYTSTNALPMIPGIDGVGQRPDGTRIYFVADDDVVGTMADKSLVDARRCVELPDHVDVHQVAAAMNPAMSAWVALRRRVPLVPGQSVLVLGATGNAGTMAVRIAKLLGAARVVGAGRDLDRLHMLGSLGADEVVQMTDDKDATAWALAHAAADVDIVLDYLWGVPAQQTIVALLSGRSVREKAMDWVQIGSVAGPTIELPSVALRSANFRLQGNGQGAVSTEVYLAELPSLVEQINSGALTLRVNNQPLADVEEIWLRPDVPGERIVLVP